MSRVEVPITLHRCVGLARPLPNCAHMTIRRAAEITRFQARDRHYAHYSGMVPTGISAAVSVQWWQRKANGGEWIESSSSKLARQPLSFHHCPERLCSLRHYRPYPGGWCRKELAPQCSLASNPDAYALSTGEVTCHTDPVPSME